MNDYNPSNDTIIRVSKKILNVEEKNRKKNKNKGLCKEAIKEILDIIDGEIENDYQHIKI